MTSPPIRNSSFYLQSEKRSQGMMERKKRKLNKRKDSFFEKQQPPHDTGKAKINETNEDVSGSEKEDDGEGSNRQKRKYARGGRRKLKTVSTILEAHLDEMLAINENERHAFYAKMVALPAVVAAGVTRDEVLSWYKRARKKNRVLASEASKAAGYMLYSWGLQCERQAEVIRLLFMVAGVHLTENQSQHAVVEGCDGLQLGTGFPYPAMSPPIVTGPDGYNCSQTPVILSSLGKRFGLYPDDVDDAHCMALSNSVMEYMSELAVKKTITEENRLISSWLCHFEHCLRVTTAPPGFFFSSRLTYCDVVVFYALTITQSQFPSQWEVSSQTVPLLKAFCTQMSNLNGISSPGPLICQQTHL